MKNLITVISCIGLMVTLFSESLPAQWKETGFPKTGVNVNAVYAKADYVFAGTDRGIYYSTDQGENWAQTKALREAYTVYEFRDFAVNSEYLYAVNEQGVHRFTLPLETNQYSHVFSGEDGGHGKNVNTIFINDGIIFIGTYNGVYKSSDNGNNWVKAQEIEPFGTGFLAAAASNVRTFTVIGSTLYAGTNGGVYKSEDAGNSWSHASTQASELLEDVAYLNYYNGYLYAVSRVSAGTSSTEGLYRSSDFGENWERISNDFNPGTRPDVKVYALINIHNVLYAASEEGFLHSDDDGDTWEPVNSDITGKQEIIQTAAVLNNKLFAGTESGLYTSRDEGDAWEQTEVKRYLIVTSLTDLNDVLYAGTEDGIYGTADGGIHWQEMYPASGEDSASVLSLAADGVYVYAGTETGLYRTNDAGEHWMKVLAAGSKVSAITVWDNDIYAAAESSIYHSTNNGETWHKEDLPSSFSSGFNTIKGIGDNLYTADDAQVYHKSKEDTSWTEAGRIIEYGIIQVQDFIIQGDGLFAATTNTGVFRSMNNGINWFSADSGIPSTSANANNKWVYSFAAVEDIFLAGTNTGIYSSTDEGENWDGVNAGIEDAINPRISKLYVYDGYVYAGTREIGVVKRPAAEFAEPGPVSVKEEKEAAPSSFTLHQNYPNPFNPVTHIKFSLPASAMVSLKIYDITGREVATLISEKMTAGSHTKRWNAENLASGIYMYRLKAGSFTQTRKLTLIK